MPPRILLVDDDADARRILRLALAPIAVIAEAANGREALRRLQAEPTAMMLLDVDMPEMSGLDVLEAGLKLVPGLVVVMLTGRTDIAVAKSALDKGARAYVTKPVDPRRLRDEVGDILAPRARGGELEERKPWRVVA